MRGVLLDPPAPAQDKLQRVFKGFPPEVAEANLGQVRDNLRRARELSGPFEPRGSLNTWEETLRSDIQDGTAVNTTVTETIVVPNFTLPARYLMSYGRTLKATLWGRYGTTGTPTIIVRLRIGGVGGVVVMTSATYTLPSGVTTVPFHLELLSVVRSAGTAGTMFGMGEMTFASAAPNTLAPQLIPATAPAVSAAIDMTAAQDLAVTVQWGTSSASNTIQTHMFTLESMN